MSDDDEDPKSNESQQADDALPADVEQFWLVRIVQSICIAGLLAIICIGAPYAAATPANPKVELLTKNQQDQLLNERLSGYMDSTFGPFANKFFVMSTQQLSMSVGLHGTTSKIEQTPLEPLFPPFYKPTLREFLDAIAVQTSSRWHYDPAAPGLAISGGNGKALSKVAVFSFAPGRLPRPYNITVPTGWKAVDNGSRTEYVPPNFKIGLDVYEVGAYSPPDSERADLFKKIPQTIALVSAQTWEPAATAQDFKSVKVGSADALYYQLNRAGAHGRQWTFMVGNHCLMLRSILTPEVESKLLPQIESMIQSIKPR